MILSKYVKKLEINTTILTLVSEITRLLGRYEGLMGPKPEPKLRRSNRIKTIQASLAIEGNTLTLDQVTAVLEGKKVLGPKKDILEVQNANNLYDATQKFDPYSVKALLKAHAILMNGLLEDAGKWRKGNIGILKGKKVSHVAPKPEYVQGLIKELILITKNSKVTPLITSSVFHHQFEMIHPFTDGNGRMGRFWQHLLLFQYHPLFEFVPVESVVASRQAAYYKALEESDRAEDSNAFVCFMLTAILDASKEVLEGLKPGRVTARDRLQLAKEKFQKKWFSRKEYMAFFQRLSSATASRDLRDGLNEKTLESQGEKALTVYRFKRI